MLPAEDHDRRAAVTGVRLPVEWIPSRLSPNHAVARARARDARRRPGGGRRALARHGARGRQRRLLAALVVAHPGGDAVAGADGALQVAVADDVAARDA